MMKANRIWLWGLVAIGALATICLVAVGGMYVWARVRTVSSRPLVLIHRPLNREQVAEGESLVVHATARSDSGLQRIELWADHQLVVVREAPPDTAPTNLVVTAPWTPRHTGQHVLLARAFAKSGVEGQGSVVVQLIDSGEAEPTGVHVVQEGETLGSIADEYGTSPEDLADLNPGLGPEGPATGDNLVVPEGAEEPSGGDGGLEGGETPAARNSSPGSFDDIATSFGLQPFFGLGSADGTPTGLRLEVLELSTTDALEALHCYMSLAGSDPRWVPDSDDNPLTDESFASLGAGSWEVGEHLTEEAAPIVVWPGDQPLPASLSCVGIVSGGTEALELGNLELAIAPEQWDGTPYPAEITGPEGGFSIAYRVTPQATPPGGIPLILDANMAIPRDVRLDDRRISLRWEYPSMEEEPIGGFRIYLNGNLQWTEPAGSRESGLPYEWFHPPCDTTYNFAVEAFRYEDGESFESFPGTAILPAPTEGCEREIWITFLTLETFDLGRDGRKGHGDVGPPYGYFFANEGRVTFDASPTGRGSDLDKAAGLTHNTTYDLATLAGDSGWRFSGVPSLFVEIPQGGALQFGYHIMDEDTGRCRDSDDVGCDDQICEATSYPYQDDAFGTLDTVTEGTLTSDDGRCRLTYVFRPAPGTAVGAGFEGGEPLPWIDVEDIQVDETTGEVDVHVRNTGTATWRWRDLVVQFETRDGRSLGRYTWVDFTLEPGQRAVFEPPGLVVAAPFDVCVLIDPDDAVLEWFERTSSLEHYRLCPQLPDLAISDLGYDGSGSGHMRVTVQNLGDAALEERTIVLRGELADGGSAGIYRSWPGVSLEPSEVVVFDIGGIGETLRQAMLGGYSITVDPDDTIAQTDGANDTYRVRSGRQLMISWQSITAPYVFRNKVEFYFDAYLVSGTTRRHVADWSALQDIPWDGCDEVDTYCTRDFGLGFESPLFDVFGDEDLEIVVTATEIESSTFEGDMTFTFVHTAEDIWGGGGMDSSGHCAEIRAGDRNHYRIEFDTYSSSWSSGPRSWVPYTVPWELDYSICW